MTHYLLLRAFWDSLRPLQWSKNILLFAALIFAGRFQDHAAILHTVEAFILFSLLASALYLVNDIRDKEADAHHPIKRFRPIASGALPVPAAAWVAFFLFGGSLILGNMLSPAFALLLGVYGIMMLLYSFGLKHVVILDIFLIAAGFVMRAVAGALVIPVSLSPWFLLCVSFLALFLAAGKRRQELSLLNENAAAHRKSLTHYTKSFLDTILIVAAACSVLSYALYTLAPETVDHIGSRHLLATFPFVLFALLRYLYLLYEGKKGGDPTTTLLSDIPILLAIGTWFCVVLAILLHLL